MEANIQTFRHSPGKLILMFLGGLFFGVFAFSVGQIDYFLIGITGIVLVVALFYATSSVKISSDEIMTTRLLGSKSLRWSDIARVSMWGQAIKLHSYDDLVLSIDPQLDGYKDILDIVFSKRPDLLDRSENNEMSRSWLAGIVTLGFGLSLIAIPVFLFFVDGEVDGIFFLFLFVIGVAVIAVWFLSPKSITLESRNLMLGFFFKEEPYSADDINSISLEKRRTRNGYVYFAQINLASGKKIKLPAFKQGAALTYQILKRWHKKAVSN
jgi:hypothetical protein